MRLWAIQVRTFIARLVNFLGAHNDVSGVNERERSGFQNVSRHPETVEDTTFVVNGHVHLTQSVHPSANGGDVEAR